MRNGKEMNNEKLEMRNEKLERGKERWEMGRHKKNRQSGKTIGFR